MNLFEMHFAWLIFWLVYWITGVALSIYNSRNRPLHNFNKVARQLVKNMFLTYLCGLLLPSCSFFFPESTLPFYVKYVFTVIFADLWFYHCHVMLHSRSFYTRFHKLHHEFTEPYALTAMYSSSYEAVVCSLISVSLGPLFFQMHGLNLYLWYGLAALNTTISHSGLGFKKLGFKFFYDHDHHHHSPAAHKYFGITFLFDTLYGTKI